MILAGDVGGTKVHLALYERGGPFRRREDETIVATADVRSLPEVVAELAGRAGSAVRSCAIGVAGPVRAGEVRGANLPWLVRSAEISRALGGVPVTLLNDLEASAHGLGTLVEGETVPLQEGEAAPGANAALLSPGTGLGACIVVPEGDRVRPVGSEGGHADFSARTDEEIDLLRHLRSHWGRVSVERVVSGPGLVNVFCWLRDTGRVPDDSGIRALPGESEPAAAISTAALEGRSGICREALRIWIGALGAEGGNLVLRGFAVGGLFLGGGIPPRILDALRGPELLEAFRSKDPFVETLERVPVQVVLATDTVLRGAARAAAHELADAR